LQSGNSLIGDDFQQAMFSFHFDSSFNPFSWKKAFPEVFQNGGFDAVIGNPPYLNVDDVWGKKDPRLTYLKTHYPHIHTDKTDILFYFLEKAVQICKGEIGMIVSRSFLEADKATKLRKWLAENSKVREVLDFRKAEVFKGVGINTAIINITGSKHVNKTIFKKWRKELLPAGYRAATLRIEENLELLEVDCQKLTGDIWNFGAENVERIIAKMDSVGTSLSSLAVVGKGMETGANSAFEVEEELFQRLKRKHPMNLYPRVTNSGIKRFKIDKPKKFLIYPEQVKKLKDLPEELVEVIENGKAALKDRAAFKRGDCDWWKFTWPLHKELFHMPKIVSPYMAERNTFAVDESNYGMYLTDTTVIYVTDKNIPIYALCALLNSEIMDFRFHYLTKLKGGGVKEYFAKQVEKLPIPFTTSNKELMMNLDDLGLRRAQSELVLESTQLEKEKSQVLQEIQQLDRQIEMTVASMFGLSEDEHSVVMNTKSQWS
jgi:hypothetical protein